MTLKYRIQVCIVQSHDNVNGNPPWWCCDVGVNGSIVALVEVRGARWSERYHSQTLKQLNDNSQLRENCNPLYSVIFT